MDIEESVSVNHSKKLGFTKVQKLDTDEKQPDDNDDGTCDRPSTSDAGQKNKGGKTTPKPKKDPSDTGENSERKKEIAKAIVNAMAAKKEAMLVIQNCSDILGEIAAKSEWGRANNEHTIGKLRAGRDKIQTFKSNSDFWDKCFLQGAAFASCAKKSWSDHFILSEARKCQELQALTKGLNTHNDSLQRMRQESLRALAEDDH